jgi:hypothetical protein
VGRRSRRAPRLTASPVEYTDADGNVLTLRGSLTAGTRRHLARQRAAAGHAAQSREDAWQREVELLFERLAVRWVIAGVPVDGQREMLARFRVASTSERAWIRDTLRAHCAELFPDVQVP